MQRYFGPQGILARKVPHFEFRPSQLEMAQAVFDCLRLEEPLLAEASTGTGKTWAYLIPAIVSGKKVVVSTGTKTLQDQILDHDIPLLKKLIAPRLDALCLKGRKNYLCRRRFREFSYQPTLWSREEARLYRQFQQWATRTPSGDRAEISWLPDHFQTWNEVCSHTEHCLGQQCDDFSRCFLTRLRMDASRAQVLVVNHHLFFADLALRRNGTGEVLPDYDAVIFDEAHQLEDTIGLYFGVHFSSVGLSDLVRDLLRECRKEKAPSQPVQRIQAIAQQVEALNRTLHQRFFELQGGQGRFRLEREKAEDSVAPICHQLIHAFEQLSALAGLAGEARPAWEPFSRRSLELSRAIQRVVEQSDSTLVYWYELTPKAVFAYGTPVDVAPVLQEHLLPRTSAVVLTSATLSVAGSFDFFRRSLGFPEESQEILLPSPFDYERQTILYIPSHFPAPQEPSFCAHLAEESLQILTRTHGRALFLFTSYRNMHDVYQRLQNRLPYPLLMQGQKPKRTLLTEFKEKVDSVLLATSSFWQGIDVPGDALSCLLIDKIPFEVPDDPLLSARMEYLTSLGKSPFFHYQVPKAIIQLKQGTGRLIRSSQDRGMIAVFDVRLLTKNYGRLFLRSLPPFPIVHHRGEVERFLIDRGLDSPEPGKIVLH